MNKISKISKEISSKNLLEVNNIEAVYNHVILVLKGVSLNVKKGGITTLLGGNGAGKTTTLKSISNLLASERGEVTKGSITFDFTKENEEFVAAIGGRGGFGNTRFKSSTNRAPKKFTKGHLGEEFWIWLQLKTIADIGIIGLPNAGKSSLLASLTSATPKIANYKFTTLNPNLGVAMYDDKEITLADIPGLIEGAHEGIGLGIKFLKHIERCKTLLHMIDITDENIEKSYSQVRKELKNYSKKLLEKNELVVLNKIDLLKQNEAKLIKDKFLKKYKVNLLTLSTLDKKSVSIFKSKLVKYAIK